MRLARLPQLTPFISDKTGVVVFAMISLGAIASAWRAVRFEQEREVFDRAIPAEFDPRHFLNLLTANADEIALLPGIGPVRAAEFVRARQAGFAPQSLLDLYAVPGFGPATVEGLRGLTTLPDLPRTSRIEPLHLQPTRNPDHVPLDSG